MNYQRADGIVLRRQPVTESSLIVTWFTREAGKLKTLAKGARRLKGPFQGKIDLFYRDELVYLPSRHSDLHLLHDCHVEESHRHLRASVPALTAASYACELVELGTMPEDPNVKIYELLQMTLAKLNRAERPVAAVLVWFELQLLVAAGWSPRWDAPTGISKVLAALGGATLAGAARVRLQGEQLHGVRQQLWTFWDTEVGRVPRSRSLVASTLQ